ncbi:MFS transporter [Streptomyces anandii]|uniref:MFS transporter n=1 Tax=Streptomyces anandii TaxID=285454 RepID=UPI003790E2ED
MPTLRSRGGTRSSGRLGLTVCFLLTGTSVAVWSARIPDVQQHVQARPAEFGLALFAGAVGALIAMHLSGRWLVRVSAPVLLKVAVTAVAVTLLGPALVDSVLALSVALFLQGFAHGSMAVAMNTCAVDVERRLARPVMSSFHSAFSVGGLAGALIGAGSTRLGVAPLLLFMAVCSAQLIVLAAVWRSLPSNVGKQRGETDKGIRLDVQRSRETRNRLLLLGSLAIAAMMCEGSVSDWCGIYLRDQLDATPRQAPVAYASYAVAMTVGRLMGDAAATRWGRQRLLRYSAAVAAVGLALAVSAVEPGLGIAGFALFGLGQACVMPQLVSLAGRAEGINAGRAVARVVGLSQVGFLVGPMVMGSVAQSMSLRIAFALTVLLSLLIAVARVPDGSLKGSADHAAGLTGPPGVTE